MSIHVMMLCLVVFSADTLWTVDFGSSPSGWIAGSQWQWLDDSVFLDIDVGGLGSGYHSNQDSLLSPVFLVPENADSLVLCIEHYWWGYGSINSPYNTAQSTSTLFMCSSSAPGQPSELWEISGYVGDNTGQTDYGYSVVDSEPISVPITNVYPGDSLGFKLSGLVETYVYDISAYANIEWNLVSFSIINFVTQRLERGTWGAVKSSF